VASSYGRLPVFEIDRTTALPAPLSKRQLTVTSKKKMSAEGAELLKSVKQMKAGKKDRTYTPEQLLAISARQSVI
jgi:hypothetical protein